MKQEFVKKSQKNGSIRISQTSLVPEMTNFCRYEAFEQERLSAKAAPSGNEVQYNRSCSNATEWELDAPAQFSLLICTLQIKGNPNI